jgi:hypothetical protein
MIFPLAGFVIGLVLGVLGAKGQGGKGLDLVQWGGVLGLIGAILGVALMVALDRMLAAPVAA